jgi:hypothetical protein
MKAVLSVTFLLFALTISYAKQKKNEPTPQCHKHISVAIATEHGIEEGAPGFVLNWWRKNADKFPGICMDAGRSARQPGTYLMLVSRSEQYIEGVTPTIRTYRSTSSYSFRDNSGYSSSGTITTSIPVRENAEFSDQVWNHDLYGNPQ